MTDYTITSQADIRPVAMAAASGDRLLFPNGTYDAGATQILLENKKLEFRAVNSRQVTLSANFLLGNMWDVRFNGMDLKPQNGTYMLDSRGSKLYLEDSRIVAGAGCDVPMALYADGGTVVFSADHYALVHDWSASLNAEMCRFVYGTAVWCSARKGFYHWFKSYDKGAAGGLVSLTMCPTAYFHNTNWGGSGYAAQGNGVTFVTLQRGATARFQADADANFPTGFQCGGVGLAINAGCGAVVEGMSPLEKGRFYIGGMEIGVVRYGAPNVTGLETRNINYFNNRRNTVVNSAGWTAVY